MARECFPHLFRVHCLTFRVTESNCQQRNLGMRTAFRPGLGLEDVDPVVKSDSALQKELTTSASLKHVQFNAALRVLSALSLTQV